MQNNYTEERKKLIKELRSEKIEPYPYRYEISHSISDIIRIFEEEKPSDLNVSAAGRIMLLRKMGKATFMHIQDFTGRIQIYLKRDIIGQQAYETLKKIDVGDIIGVIGNVFTTRTGETTVLVNGYTLLSKAVRQLPEKYHGIRDKGMIYRQRCLDMIMNADSRKVFYKRSLILKYIRDWLYCRKFAEVDIPIIQMMYGGAEARPFKTHVNALETEAFLSISPELYLKRYIAGGFERVFSMQKAFRNEGIDATHNPEFTLLEIYQAYADYNDMMLLTESLISDTVTHINGSLELKAGGNTINMKAPFKRFPLLTLLGDKLGRDPYEMTMKELEEIAKEIECKEHPKPGASRGELIMFLFEALCEKDLIEPTFVIDYPMESSPLCKVHRKDSRLIERFELYINGREFANAYSEQNDPVIQREALEAQSQRLRAGFAEAMPMDEYFVRAVEYGMPPAGGVGLGIDRLVMLITQTELIKDVITFPLVKIERGLEEEMETMENIDIKESGQDMDSEKGDEYMDPGITKKRAHELYDQYIKSSTLKGHTLSSAYVMKGVAKHFGYNEDYFYIAGLLHDLDFDMEQSPEKHGLLTIDILREEGVDRRILDAIKRHNEGLGEARETFLDHALASSESITGLVYATALILPGRKLRDVKPSSVVKRMKKKEFARKVSRETIMECEKLGLSLEEFAGIAIDSMLEIAEEIGV